MLNPPHLQSGEKLVLFDGVCRFCNGWSHFLLRHDKHAIFKLCTVQSKEGQDILRYFSLPTDNYETMLYIESGVAYKKSTAFIRIATQLPWPYKVAAVLYCVPKAMRDWLYHRIALNRYELFGKYSSCPQPSQQHLSRFINKENL